MGGTKYLVEFLVMFLFCKIISPVSMFMEDFMDGVCISTHADIPKWGRSYMQCLNECRSRTECTAVNVHVQLRHCHLNMDNSGSETNCPGYVLSKRSEWIQSDLPGCFGVTCSASQACSTDSSGSADCYYRECPPIEDLENGRVMGNQRYIGARLVYACNTGYSLSGDGSRYCTDMGDWSGRLPTCVPECPPIEDLDNGRVMGNQRYIGARLVYACNTGYSLSGDGSRYCTDMGDWSGRLPTCVPDPTQAPAQTGNQGNQGNSGGMGNAGPADSAEVV